MIHLVSADTAPYSTQDMMIYAALVFILGAILNYLGRLFISLLKKLFGLCWKAFKRLTVRSKRHYIVYNHARNHLLPTAAHNEPLFKCLDNPCDTLFIDAQALGVPSEAPVSGSDGLLARK